MKVISFWFKGCKEVLINCLWVHVRSAIAIFFIHIRFSVTFTDNLSYSITAWCCLYKYSMLKDVVSDLVPSLVPLICPQPYSMYNTIYLSYIWGNWTSISGTHSVCVIDVVRHCCTQSPNQLSPHLLPATGVDNLFSLGARNLLTIRLDCRKYNAVTPMS